MVITGIVIGAGNRGFIYADYAIKKPDLFKIVGVADPNEFRRNKLANLHKIEQTNIYEDWKQVVERDRFADCVLITTQDRMHKDPAISFAHKKYHVFLEKPMASTYGECKEIVHACKQNNVMLAVGHVLRYHPHALKIKRLIDDGVVGDVVNIQHLEPIGHWHFAHSFVRGNWSVTSKSNPLLLAKCCHDVDLIDWWMGGISNCKQAASFGSLIHFKKENKPEGSSDRCVTCAVEEQCPYSAKKLYLNLVQKGYKNFPVDVITDDPTEASVLQALNQGPYGRCVYSHDNDVCDNQVVILQYDNGSTATLTTTAFTEKLCVRKVTVCGTKGEISSQFDEKRMYVYDFLSKKTTAHEVEASSGHSECDYMSIKSFVDAIQQKDQRLILTGADESLRSHLHCFAAEEARLQSRVVKPEEIR